MEIGINIQNSSLTIGKPQLPYFFQDIETDTFCPKPSEYEFI